MARLLPLYSSSSQTKIERLAREHFENMGCPANHDLDHWLWAEKEFLKTLREVQPHDTTQANAAPEVSQKLAAA